MQIRLPTFTSDEFKLADVTAAVTSNSWWMYARMVTALNRMAADFTSFLESCPCHSWLRSHDDDDVRVFQQVRKHLGLSENDGDGLSYTTCPLAGMKALQLAQGVTADYFSSYESFLPELLGAAALLASPSPTSKMRPLTITKGGCACCASSQRSYVCGASHHGVLFC